MWKDRRGSETQGAISPDSVKSRITTGWADDIPKSGKGKKGSNAIEHERFNTKKRLSEDLSENDILVIPEIDDLPEDNSVMVIAPQPSISRTNAYKELNSELQHAKIPGLGSVLEDIDLSCISLYLHDESSLEEPDDVWTWEKLFTEISAEMHSSKEREISSPVEMPPFIK